MYSYLEARLMWLKHHYGYREEKMLDHPRFKRMPAVIAVKDMNIVLGSLTPEVFRACILELAKLCEEQQKQIEALEHLVSVTHGKPSHPEPMVSNES